MTRDPKKMNRTRVLLVDDQRLFRQSLKLLLEQDPEIEVTGEAVDGQEAVILATEHRPDLILLDLELPGMRGSDVARMIMERLPETKILMLSVHDEDEHIRECLACGVAGYILKDADHREFLKIIKSTMKGEVISSPFLVTRPPGPASLLQALTPKELDILKILSQAKSNKEIAQELNLSPETIKFHLQKVYAKLGVSTRAEAMRLYLA